MQLPVHQQQSQLQQQHRDDAGGEAGDDAGEDAGVDAGEVFWVVWVRTGPTLLFAYSYFDGLSMSSSGRPLPVAMNSNWTISDPFNLSLTQR